MKAKIKSKFLSLLLLAGFILACAAAAFVVTAPLWLFATKKPAVYSALLIALAAAFFVFKTVRWAIKRGAKKPDAKD